MAKGFKETAIFCRFLSCHISVKWPALKTVFKAGSWVCRQHLDSCSPPLSPNSLLTLSSNVTCLHDETLFFLCTPQWYGPHYLFLSRTATGMLLPLQLRGSWGVPETFPGFSSSFFCLLSSQWLQMGGFANPQTGVLLSGITDPCRLCHPCSLSRGLDGPQALLSLCDHGWRGLDNTGQSY